MILLSYLLTGCVQTIEQVSTGKTRTFYPWSKPTFEEWKNNEIKKNQKKAEKHKQLMIHRLKDIKPLDKNKEYTCEVYPNMFVDKRKKLDITFGKYTIDITEYPFGKNDGSETNMIDRMLGEGITTTLTLHDKYSKYIKYIGFRNNSYTKIEAKVFTKNGLKNKSFNFELNDIEKYYCIEVK